MLRAKRVHARRVEERPGASFARVPERPDAPPVGRGHGHLDRVLDTVTSADALDQPDSVLDRRRWIVLEPKRQREEEEDLRVGRALDERVEARVDLEDEVALDLVEVADRARCASTASVRGGTDGSSSAGPATRTTRGCARRRPPTARVRRGRAGSGRSRRARCCGTCPACPRRRTSRSRSRPRSSSRLPSSSAGSDR